MLLYICNVEDNPAQQRLIPCQMSVVLRVRNPKLDHPILFSVHGDQIEEGELEAMHTLYLERLQEHLLSTLVSIGGLMVSYSLTVKAFLGVKTLLLQE